MQAESGERVEFELQQPELLKPKGRVLSTMEEDGSRRWLKPRLSEGKYHRRRRWVAIFLIFLFTAIPFVKIGDRPLLLLDIVHREFFVFGVRFLPTDTVIMALGMVSVFLSIFLFTALFGRVWCGWACPQTVYMEFVFRPIERFFDGTWGRGGKPRTPPAPWRVALKYLTYYAISFYLAHTFLAYFVGVDELARWMWYEGPWEHPVSFGVVVLVTVAMLFDFGFFREQLCIIACPYGRFQSVLLDRKSTIVAYDRNRGEPRGHKAKDENAASRGDCIDCGNCVTTCPTGIDIREGLQLECINCTQCIDACDAVMVKIGRPPQLIRYSSQAADAGEKPSWFRPRVFVYPTILAVFVSILVYQLAIRGSYEAVMLRNPGIPYQVDDAGVVTNSFRLKVTNRAPGADEYRIESVAPEGVSFELTSERISVDAESDVIEGVRLRAEKSMFQRGRLPVSLSLVNGEGETLKVKATLVGP